MYIETPLFIWGISSDGRAPALHAGGQRFDSAMLHHIFNLKVIILEQIKLSNYPTAVIFKVNKLEVEKIDFDLCGDPAETIDSYYKRQAIKPTLLSNAGFFDMSPNNYGSTCMTFVNDYQVIHMEQTLLEGMCIDDSGNLILDFYSDKYKDFMSAYPVFMKDGQLVTTPLASELNYNARRTIVGYDDDNIYLIGINSPGMNYPKIKNMLIALGVKNAINLDGGGSTRILKNGVLVTDDTAYNRPVDSVFALYLKNIPTIYRVQTGAFSSKSNAENYKRTIQAIPDTIGAGYKNAYVRLVDGLYKVQVGAFSVKENAERVLNDLQSKGYNAFITTK